MRTYLFLSVAIFTLCVSAPCRAQSLVETFSGPTLNAGLEMSQAESFTFSDGAAINTSNSRNYVRTVATDFRATDFTLTLTYTLTDGFGGGGMVFIGLGSGSPDLNFYREPSTALYFRHAPNDFNLGRLSATINNGSTVDELPYFAEPGAGTHRALLSKTGDILTFSLDEYSSSGAFTADYTTSFDLAETRFGFLNSSTSRLFFGSEKTGASFDALTITAVPEPGAYATLAGVAALGFVAWRRRRQ